MKNSPAPPTLPQFLETTREQFAFLLRFGFAEVSPPAHRADNAFQVWFQAGQRFVVVVGEGWGTMASVTLEHGDGLELDVIYLVPAEDRPGRRKGKRQTTQLEQLHEDALRVKKYAADFLAGDHTRFRAIAKSIPPYKRPRP